MGIINPDAFDPSSPLYSRGFIRPIDREAETAFSRFLDEAVAAAKQKRTADERAENERLATDTVAQLLAEDLGPELERELERASKVTAQTLGRYKGAFNKFSAFCDSIGVSSLPANPAVAAFYLRWLDQQGRPLASIRHARFGIAAIHALRGHALGGPEIKLTLRAIARRHAEAGDQEH
jgi:hypothetical protein